MRELALLLALALPVANAFSNTFPTIAWSSHSTSVLSTGHEHVDLKSLLVNDDICEYHAVVVVDQPGLRTSDLRSLSSSSPMVRAVNSAPASLQIPYLRAGSQVTPQDIATAIAHHCGSKLINHPLGSSGLIKPSTNQNHVVCVDMPPLDGTATHRKATLANHENMFISDLEKLTSVFPKHLVFLSGSHPPRQRRQSNEDDTHTSLAAPSSVSGILHRYQLLTPGLIISLLIVFFVLIPAMFMGISALASIQSPLRLEADKKFIQTEKKNQ